MQWHCTWWLKSILFQMWCQDDEKEGGVMAEYIEREALLKNARSVLEFRKQHNMDAKEIYSVISWLKWVPAADVAPVVHGRWIKNEKASENHVEAIYVCSACQNWEAWGETEKTNYCPNCGARMDGK